MRLILTAALLFSVLTSRAQQITVRSFKSDDIDFRVYRTYFWAAHADSQLDEGSYLMNDLILKADIREAIHEEMEARGYKRSNDRADLLINFRIFTKPVTIRGREGYGSRYWTKEEISSIDIGVDEIKLDAGTLIISLLDRRSGKLVWQGVADGLGEDEQEIISSEGKVRKAISLIMDQYSYPTVEYTKR